MTTTAEKIKVMQAFEDGETIESRPSDGFWMINSTPKWNWAMTEYRIKPPDPEPMERWLNTYDSKSPDSAHTDPEKAKSKAAPTVIRIAVHMREVTPQMLQDEKDAARYRWLKSKAKSFERNPPLFWQPVEKWDEEIDKAMESDER